MQEAKLRRPRIGGAYPGAAAGAATVPSAGTMSAFAADWLNLLLRWAHLIAGIGWIGTSFYFIALDLSLERRAGAAPGVAGSAWQVHGGGFYHVEKYQVAPDALPAHLVWFRWEAYITWLTGFGLLVVQYYLNPEAWLIDPAVMPLSSPQAIMISIASLVFGWFAYDGICRSRAGRHPVLLAGLVFALLLAAAWIYTHVFSARSALVHAGSLAGTIMAANVFGVIIPNQRKIVAALRAGEDPDPRHGAVGRQRSVHNTYLTLPVISAHGERALPAAHRSPAGVAARRAHPRRRRERPPPAGALRGGAALRRARVDRAGHRGVPDRRAVDYGAPAARCRRRCGGGGRRRRSCASCTPTAPPATRPSPRAKSSAARPRTWCWRRWTTCAATRRSWSRARSSPTPCRSATRAAWAKRSAAFSAPWLARSSP